MLRHIYVISCLILVALFGTTHAYLTTAALFIIAGLMLRQNGGKARIILFITCSLLGPLAETIAIVFGQWNYTHVDIFVTPLWLFPLWGCAGLYMHGLGKRLEKHFEKKR